LLCSSTKSMMWYMISPPVNRIIATKA
jgi:hypothetical protein